MPTYGWIGIGIIVVAFGIHPMGLLWEKVRKK